MTEQERPNVSMETQEITDASGVGTSLPTQQGPVTVSALSVLLSACELAQSRGAFKLDEARLISQAYAMLKAQSDAETLAAKTEAARAQASAAASAAGINMEEQD